MPTDINCVLQFSCTVDGHTVEQGSHVPFVHTITVGEILDHTAVVPAGSSEIIWHPVLGHPSEFAFAWIISDVNLYMGIVSTATTDLCYQVMLYANRPHVLWGDDVIIETSGAFWGAQTLDTAASITVKNPNAGPARVRVVIGK